MNAPDTLALRALLDVDRLVHEPARLAILTILAEADAVEFRFIEAVTGLTRGNLSSHASRLEEAGYLEVDKDFRGRAPRTRYRISPAGRHALERYRASITNVVGTRGAGAEPASGRGAGPDSETRASTEAAARGGGAEVICSGGGCP